MPGPKLRRLPPPTLYAEKNAAGELVLRSTGPATPEERLAAVQLRPGDRFFIVRPDDMRGLMGAALMAGCDHGRN